MVLTGRIELPSPGPQPSGTTYFPSSELLLVERTGFEPVISALKGRRPSPSSPTLHCFWLSRVGLNHRPQSYQDCATTTELLDNIHSLEDTLAGFTPA
jgi:hypothetical protein